MQLVHINAIKSQSLQAALHSLPQVRRGRIVGPLIRPRAIPSTFGSDHEVARIRRQRFSDQFFANMGTVRISRIDEVDSQLDGAAKDCYCGRRIFRWSPDSLPCNTHGPVAETVDREFTSE